ncbi:hypothetical protein D0Y65_038971 [Glycine soja]|uniref:Uncharacterized protein n=1 Tax=Glycine soja TaxID=3848 RepID=A0A445H6X2_GLYSO|nr:hypothetical protein D0Y65_038971 [Glycine soja]
MQIYTSCYHGILRLVDAEKEIFDLVFESDESIFALSQPTNVTNCLYLAEGSGGLTIWDNMIGITWRMQLLLIIRIRLADGFLLSELIFTFSNKLPLFRAEKLNFVKFCCSRAKWGWDDSYLFVGNLKRGADVVSTVQRMMLMTLESQHMSAIPCRFHTHYYEVRMLVGATSGGQI